MAFFSAMMRVFFVAFVLGLGACSSVNEADLYGYEDDFIIPEPDMIPVFSDDNPGRTVDEMLNLKPQEVTVKKASAEKKGDEAYEHEGRFGSKEKIALRKGLNAPVEGIVYGSQKRKEAGEVRPLEIKKIEKNEMQAVSEEEILAQIVAPKSSTVELIEVVSVRTEPKNSEPKRLLPEEQSPKNKEEQTETVLPLKEAAPVVELKKPQSLEIKKQQPAGLQKKENAAVVLPVKLKAPEPKKEEVRLKPLLEKEKIVLLPPGRQDRIVLKRPEIKKSDSSVEIFLDE